MSAPRGSSDERPAEEVTSVLLSGGTYRTLAEQVGYVAEQRAKLGPVSRAQRNTLIAFSVTVTLWVLPGLVALVVPITKMVRSGLVFDVAGAILILLLLPVLASTVIG